MADPNKWPDVNKVTPNDLVEILSAGVDDLRAAPQYGLLVGFVYAAAGWLLFALLWYFNLIYLVYPMAMGFALIAPFASVVFYAVSDYLERGKPLSWAAIRAAVWDAKNRDLRWMALITGFTFFMWVDYAALLFLSFMGFDSIGPNLLHEIFGTSHGLFFLAVGNLTGAIIAFLIFSISVVTYPMLYDRDVDFVTAIMTSVRLVIANPGTMLMWCATIGLFTGMSLLSSLLGLIVMLPVVGHASWHLYRRAVGPAKVPEAATA